MRSKAEPGATLKALRRSSNWTLAYISQRTAIPVSTLSKIENNQASPSYDQLVRLSDALQVDIAQLFSALRSAPAALHSGRRSISKGSNGRSIETAHELLTYLHTDLLNKAFTPIIAEIRCRRIEDYGEFQRHAGEEFLYAVRGAVELHTEQYSPLLLREGESIYFDSSMAHAYVAHGNAPCTVLSICTARQVHSMDSPIEAADEPADRPRVRAAPRTKPVRARINTQRRASR
jgi:transcriptional regulator with XRE-family HTH domain